MKNTKGFSLIELLVTMAIMSIVVALSGPIYTKVLMGVKKETVSSEVHQDLVTGTELIRLDLEHAGFGVARNETALPAVWDEDPDGAPNTNDSTLELRSVLNNTNQTTMGWALLNCSTPNQAITTGTYIVNQKDTAGLQSMVLLNPNENFGGLVTPGSYTCPATTGIYSAYPFDSASFNACTTGWCTRIIYHLSSTAHGTPASRAACAQGTFDLRRRVGNATLGNAIGDPVILNCVADFRVRFDIDTDGLGVGASESQLSVLPAYATAGALMDEVKNMEFLILIQTGQRDNDLNSSPNTTVSGVTLSAAGVTNANNYRWKVIKISGNPMSWR